MAPVPKAEEHAPEVRSTRDTIVTKRDGKQAWPGYPEAEFVSLDNINSGYFLRDKGYEDVAVLLCQTPLNYGYDLDQYLRHFESYAQQYTPHKLHGDKFTNLSAWNLGNRVDTSSAYFGFGMNGTGYGDRTNFTRPFGGPRRHPVACMIHDAAVKTVSFGGRPQPRRLTQGVGGVKGTQVASFQAIQGFAGRATRKLPEVTDRDGQINKTEIADELGRFTDYVINRSNGGAVNFRDSILPDHRQDGTPAQI
ncbi:hypothetical protein PG985_016211 [Apiospora marii]|uniref:uncharacterized protein n=1 Tax=Apiospora marii TaxID=335849 RepID=UPI00312DBCFB